MTPQETEPDLPVSVQETLAGAWVNSGLPQWPTAVLGATGHAGIGPFEGCCLPSLPLP